jgi:hypothetical protein
MDDGERMQLLMMHAMGCTEQKHTIEGEIATLQARTSTMSSAFDRQTQPSEERMEILCP